MGENLSLERSNLEHAATEFLQAGYRVVLKICFRERNGTLQYVDPTSIASISFDMLRKLVCINYMLLEP